MDLFPPLVRRAVIRSRFARWVAIALAASASWWVASLVADRRWFDRHVFWPYYLKRPVGLEYAIRIGLAAVGVAVALVVAFAAATWLRRRKQGIVPAFNPYPALRMALALALAVVAAEGIIRLLKPVADGPGYYQYRLRIGQPDPHFGWVAPPSHTTTVIANGRKYVHAVNDLGFRSRTETARPDLAKPALLVAGESIAVGHGLDFDDTFAARVGRDLGLEVVNVAEGGYGIDQAYLRLQKALPLTTRPTVVLTVVVLLYLGRSARDDRPRLILDGAPELAFAPAASGFLARARLRDILHNRVTYVGEARLIRALAVVRRTIAEIARAARARGAVPLFIIPSLGHDRSLDDHDESGLLSDLFPDPSLPFVIVDLPSDLLLPDGNHPNARGAQKIADAIETKLCWLPDATAGVLCRRHQIPGPR